MSSHFDILPLDIIYNVISYLDKYEISNLTNISKNIRNKFNNDDIWKEMVYHNLKNPVINVNHSWRDVYLDNLDIKSKYNVQLFSPKIMYDYVFVYRNIIEPNKNDINWINKELRNNIIYQSTSIIYIKKSDGNILDFGPTDKQKNDFEEIINYISYNLEINIPYGFYVFAGKNYYPFELSHMLTKNWIYGNTGPNNNNIISFSFNKLNILLLEAPPI